MTEVQTLLQLLSTRDDGHDAHEAAVSTCRWVLSSLSQHLGREITLDAQTVQAGDFGLTAAGVQLLAAGTAPPFPLRLTARVSVDLTNSLPSVVVVLLLTARDLDGTEVLLGPNDQSYVWHELDPVEETWRVGGWSVDEHGEFQA